MRLTGLADGDETLASDPRIQSELDVLTAVEQGVVVTQAALTKRIGISIGLINALLKRAILMGYVKTRQAPYKRYIYYLTPKGFAKKSRLVAEYLDSSPALLSICTQPVCRAHCSSRQGRDDAAGSRRKW